MTACRASVCLALTLLAATSSAQSEAGPWPVGFTSHWSLDPARRYDTRFADGSTWAAGEDAARPVLVNVWYPAAPPAEGGADAVRMHRGDYLDISTDDARVQPFARALEAYARSIVADELLQEPAAERDADDEAALAAALGAPAGAVRDATPAGGRHPLVIYHSGFGSSFEDNAAFCERLAAHGYVVAGSAFPQADGASFNIDAHEGSLRDLDFLVRELSARPDVDGTRLALAGHSGGAHTALRAQALPDAEWDALILLDTTQDYWPAREPRWTHSAEVLAAPERFDVPMLVTTGSEACFDLMDVLGRADRWYLTFRELSHNEFIEQGVLTAELAARRAASGDDAAVAAARTARDDFEEIGHVACLFLDMQLKGDASAEAELAADASAGAPRNAPFQLEHAAAGSDAPPAWDPESLRAPRPRQLRGALAALGAPALLERLERWHVDEPELPIFGMTCGMSLCWDLVDSGRLDEARVLAPFYGRIDPQMVPVVLWFVDITSRRPGFESWTGSMLQMAVLAAPDDKEAQAAWEAWQAR